MMRFLAGERADPASSPSGIVTGHTTDEGTDLRPELGPAAPAPWPPTPVEGEPFAMPPEDGELMPQSENLEVQRRA